MITIIAQTTNSGTQSSSGSFNILQNDGGGAFGGSSLHLDPQLVGTTPADNGGPTPTFNLRSDSPALDAGKNSDATSSNFDQRGSQRPFDLPDIANASGGDGSDIGAVEVQQPLLVFTLDLDSASAGTGAATTFTEQTPVVIAPNLVIRNATILNSASVQLGTNADNALETLSATTNGTAITANYDAATRTLSLSGADTVEHYRQVLASVTYNNSSDAPDTTNRTLVFSVTNSEQVTATATATLQVLAVNDAPIANAQNLTTAEDTPKTLALSATDVDTPIADLTYRIVTEPAHGILSGTAANRTYTPSANFNGSDSFTFVANDGNSDSAPATISLTVTPVADAPQATDDTYSTAEDTPLIVNAANGVLANDSDVDGDALTVVKLSDPTHGALTLNSDGSFSYTPNANFNGLDSFTYQAQDGALDSNVATVTLQVLAVNDVPIANDDSATTDEDKPIKCESAGQ